VHKFVCSVLVERGVLFCVTCVILRVVSYCSTTATGKTPFTFQLNNNISDHNEALGGDRKETYLS
jgi:hypothetical protein